MIQSTADLLTASRSRYAIGHVETTKGP